MVCKNRKELKFALYLLTLFFLLASCASTPKPETFYQGRSGFGLMPEGAPLNLTAEVKSVRPILDSLNLGGMTGAEIKDFLDRSDTLTIAVYEIPGQRHFYAAATGRFPNTSSGIFFSASSEWEKKTSASGMPYWYSARSWLAVSLTSREAYLSDVDPFVPPPGATVPEALPAMQRGAVLYGWMNDPSQAINRLITTFNIPIEIPAERLLFAVHPAAQGQYYAVLRFETPTATQAAALVRVFAMAKLGMALADFSEREEMEALARALFANNPTQDGSSFIIQTGPMDGKDIALLFNTMSVY